VPKLSRPLWKSRRSVCTLPLTASLVACASTGAPPKDVLLRSSLPVDHASLFDWLSLPIQQGRSYEQYSTRDREQRAFPGFDPRNKDFNNFYAVCGEQPEVTLQTSAQLPCEPGIHGHVIAADDAGPGVVSRIWFAWGGRGFVDERIRIYADDFTGPVYEALLSSWRAGEKEPFVAPLTASTSNAIVSYVPIAYRQRMRVVIDDLRPSGYYYSQTNVQRGEDLGVGFADTSAAALSDLQEQVHAAADSELALDETFDLAPKQRRNLFERSGRGVITQLRFTLTARTPDDLRGLVLRMHWERAEQAAVELPLSAFFGAELALAEYNTLPLSAAKNGDQLTLEANWPLPYREHAHISLHNTGTTKRQVQARIQQGEEALPDGAGHFYASYRRSVGPFQPGDRYQHATLQGAGKYVGTLMYLQGTLDTEAIHAHYPLSFLEGDERITVDGADSVLGTGTEDYFDAGYYWGAGRFDSPFATLISREEEADGGSITAARWHILSNSIEFKESLDFSLEYGANRPQSATDYASVAFYYLFD
jgi:hypothetical protein